MERFGGDGRGVEDSGEVEMGVEVGGEVEGAWRGRGGEDGEGGEAILLAF